MEKNISKAYLEMLKEQLDKELEDVRIETDDDESTISFNAKAPFDDDREIGYNITISEFAEDIYTFSILLFAYENVKQEFSEDIKKLVSVLNMGIIPGTFIYSEDADAIIYRCGFLVDTEDSVADITKQLSGTISDMERILSICSEYFDILLTEEKSLDEIIAQLKSTREKEEEEI